MFLFTQLHPLNEPLHHFSIRASFYSCVTKARAARCKKKTGWVFFSIPGSVKFSRVQEYGSSLSSSGMGQPRSPTINFTPTLKIITSKKIYTVYIYMHTYTHTFSLVLYTLGCEISKACPSSRPSVAMVTGGGGGYLKGHHTLSALGSPNDKKGTKKKNEGRNNIGWRSGKDKSVDEAVSYLLGAAGCGSTVAPRPWNALGTLERKTSSQVEAPAHRPLMEVGVISEVAQPGLPYRLSQLIMVSC